MRVVVFEDAAADLEAGRRFYEDREPGVGDYFVEQPVCSETKGPSAAAGFGG